MDLDEAKSYIEDQFDDFDDISWLEGWVHGYTDIDHGDFKDERKKLLGFIVSLKDNPVKNILRRVKVLSQEEQRELIWLIDVAP